MLTPGLLKMVQRLMRKKTRKGHRTRKRHRKRYCPRGQQPTQRRCRKHAQSLAHWLASTSRQVDYIRGDGNCFFRALSKEMYGTEDYHAEWRQAVCDLIEAHPNVFSQFVDCGTSSGCSPSSSGADTGAVAEHVGNMRQLGTWATSCEIYGAASLLRREIYVLAPSPCEERGEDDYLWLLFCPCSLASKPRRKSGRGGGGGSGRGRGSSSRSGVDGPEGKEEEEDLHPCYITLCHTNGNHYDRITPAARGVCNCQLAPPCLNGGALFMDAANLLEFEDDCDEKDWEGDRFVWPNL